MSPPKRSAEADVSTDLKRRRTDTEGGEVKSNTAKLAELDAQILAIRTEKDRIRAEKNQLDSKKKVLSAWVGACSTDSTRMLKALDELEEEKRAINETVIEAFRLTLELQRKAEERIITPELFFADTD